MSALASLLSFDTAVLVAGIVALYLGAEALVEGASRLAIGLGLRAAIVGVTIVAFATTTPELFVAVLSGLGYSADLGLGAIVGSNIANIGLVLGISALIQPMGVSTTTLRRHVPFMIAAALALVLLGMDGRLGPLDGGILLIILVAFTGYLVYRAQAAKADAIATEEIDIEDEDEVSATFKDVLYLGLGLLLLFVGSNWLIQGGKGLLEAYGFSTRFIGLTILAFGTSLPELAASVVSAVRGEAEFSIGNVVGSNIYNVVAVLGILAIMVPVSVPESTITLDFPALLVFTFGVIAMMLRNRDVSRLDGGILVVGYLVFFWLILP
ncbi:Na+/Ca2+-antiporter [Haloferax elongans ATCC BAA-1513]|uniref:Na+/Ca2+-antiporter n=1 Tax=Haloferax elongans ATCC BAA-1513 TaxID=1230453 RepID=M0HSD4_HALEO|nr:calcium/sodium antiporter [Haloferax elongans]ELZ86612.1 Na+/Ca2+-antiporter [Haloferax elongans ATCC BAA-1513]